MLDKYNNAMLNAYVQATYSPDPSTQNGAVLLSDICETIGVGCNNFPYGVNKSYWNSEDKQEKYNRVVHAEVSAILSAARRGHSTVGATLVCPWAACSNCAKHIAVAEIKNLVRHSWNNNGVTNTSHWYEDVKIGDEIMTEAGVQIIEIDLVPSDIQLRKEGKLWSTNASS